MLRLFLALFLLIPTPVFAEEVPGEVTVNEDFSDSTYQSGLTISGGNQAAYIYTNEQDRYGTTGASLAITSGTYLFEFAEDVYEVGFIVGAVNNAWSIKWYYADGTDETVSKNAQNNGNLETMYETIYKSYTDYNAVAENTDKFITKFEIILTDISVLDTLYWQYVEIPVTTTTSSTTTTSTTTTTTTTTVPPKPEPEPEPYIPPPPPPPTPEEIIVDIVVEGVDKTYTQADVNDGTIERDQERIDNESEFGCFMTNAQIERGDCLIIIEKVEVFEDDIIEEEVIVEEIEEDVEVIIPENDVVVLDPPKKEVIEDEVVEFEELPIEFEIIEFDLEDIVPKDVVEIPIPVEVIKNEPVKEDIPEVLEEDTPDTTLPLVEIEPEREEIVFTEEEVAVEVAEVVEILEDIVVEEATVEEVVEVLEEVNDIGVQNLSSVTEETQEIIQEVVEEAIADVAELTEEQVEVVAEVLQVETEDVAIIAESIKDDEVIAEAVEEYVERAVQNADVENYTLADVVTEVQFETFIDNPIQTFIDIDIQEINFSDIGNDMTTDQKEKAQEVVVPVILTRIATMAAFVYRRGNV